MDLVVGIVSSVHITVVDIGIVDVPIGRASAGAGRERGGPKIGSGAGVNPHDARGCIGDVLTGISNDVNL